MAFCEFSGVLQNPSVAPSACSDIKHLSDDELECLTVDIDMTEANMEHPTAGRRRRHKSPPTLHVQIGLPMPRLDDHLDVENGPSDEEGEKEAKRQRSRAYYSYFNIKPASL